MQSNATKVVLLGLLVAACILAILTVSSCRAPLTVQVKSEQNQYQCTITESSSNGDMKMDCVKDGQSTQQPTPGDDIVNVPEVGMLIVPADRRLN